VLATAVLFKPNLAPVAAAVACAWACARRWRPLVHLAAGALAGTGLALAAGTAALGTARPWADWLGVLPELLESPRTLAEGNFAVTGLLRAAFGVDLSPWLAVAFLVAIAAAARRRPGTVESDDAAGALAFERTYLAVGLGAAAMVLSARLVWLHYLVLAVPLVVFLLRPNVPGAERRLPRGGALAAALGLTTGPKLVFIDGVGAVMGYAIAIALATAALFALGIAELRRLAGAGATSRTA
jgi:hypothetical protein